MKLFEKLRDFFFPPMIISFLPKVMEEKEEPLSPIPEELLEHPIVKEEETIVFNVPECPDCKFSMLCLTSGGIGDTHGFNIAACPKCRSVYGT